VAGRDPQLDRGIEYLMEKIKAEPRQVPEVPAWPVRAKLSQECASILLQTFPQIAQMKQIMALQARCAWSVFYIFINGVICGESSALTRTRRGE
jgi:hypothetical protein